MAIVRYEESVTVFPFVTHGWFIFSFVFIFAVSAAYSAAFCFASRWIGQKLAWLLMLSVSFVLISLAVRSALPSRRIRAVIGEEASRLSKVEQLHIIDSFSDGLTYVGIIAGPEEAIDAISRYRPLKQEAGSYRLLELQWYFEGHNLPDSGLVYYDDHGCFYYQAESRKIYFYYKNRLSPEPQGSEQDDSADR